MCSFFLLSFLVIAANDDYKYVLPSFAEIYCSYGRLWTHQKTTEMRTMTAEILNCMKVHRKLAQCNSPLRFPLYCAISFYHTTGHIIMHSTFHHHYLCVPLRPTSLCWVQRWLISGCLPGKGFIRCHVLAWLWPHHHDLHSPGLLGDYGGWPQLGGPPSSDGTCGCLTVPRWKVCAKFKLKYALGKRHKHKLCMA